MGAGIRVGFVSSVSPQAGTVQVTYPDRDRMVTGDFPVLIFGGEYSLPEVNDLVLVLHLSNDVSSGVVLGKFWNDQDIPDQTEWYKKLSDSAQFRKEKDKLYLISPEIIFSGNAGEISLKELVELKRKVEDLEAGNT